MVLQKDIEKAAEMIRQGKVVAFPTETVYGLGANALDPVAVARIFELKERPSFDPLIVHVAQKTDISQLINIQDERVWKLTDHFWPGPLTLVLPKSELVPGIVTSGLKTVGLRMPDHEVALSMIKMSGCPVAAPSANKFGQLSPTKAAHVRKQLQGVDFILDGGPTRVGIESTIITLHDEGFEILRHGVITQRQLEKVVPCAVQSTHQKTHTLAPGMLKSHYSPAIPIYIAGENMPKIRDISQAALLSYSGENTQGYKYVKIISPKGDLKTYAAELFSVLHELEDMNVDFIVAEPVPEKGIGIAIMDKLRKAAYRYAK